MELKDLKIVTIFAYLLIGVILIGVIANMVEENTEVKTMPNDYIDISTARDTHNDFDNTTAISLTNDEIHTFTGMYNETSGTALTVNTDYLVDYDAGTFILENTSATRGLDTNFTNSTYTYEMDNYVEDGTSRTIITLIVIFFAIGVLAIGMQALGLFDWKQF